MGGGGGGGEKKKKRPPETEYAEERNCGKPGGKDITFPTEREGVQSPRRICGVLRETMSTRRTCQWED